MIGLHDIRLYASTKSGYASITNLTFGKSPRSIVLLLKIFPIIIDKDIKYVKVRYLIVKELLMLRIVDLYIF
jgi:hypothetical protein